MNDFNRYSVKCRITEVLKSDCTGEERHPVSFLVAVGLDQCVAEAAHWNVHSFEEGVGGVW